MTRLQVRSKLWLEVDGEPLLGEGRERLLRLIQSHGSISNAAREMGLSYRKAWSFLRAMEEKTDYKLVCRHKGGKGGGESSLTADALELLDLYDRLRNGLNQEVDKKFAALFPQPTK